MPTSTPLLNITQMFELMSDLDVLVEKIDKKKDRHLALGRSTLEADGCKQPITGSDPLISQPDPFFPRPRVDSRRAEPAAWVGSMQGLSD